MIPDTTIIDLCALIYHGNPFDWDVYENGSSGPQVCYGIKHIETYDVIVLRGSVTIEDWKRDFNAFPDSQDSRLGPVHAGFFAGMEAAWSAIKPKVGSQPIVAGHSLGAARAAILTGLMVLDGLPPIRRVVCGEPKAGFQPLADIVAKIEGASYSNGDDKHHDIVVDVPFSFPPENYMRPSPLIRVSAAPSGDIWNRYGPFAYHHIPLYQQGVAAYGNSKGDSI